MRFHFGHFTLDAARRELRAERTLIEIEPQVFDLLSFLIERRDRVVSRDDLIENVWGGRIVSDSTLATRINAARRAIGDDGTAQRWIKTVTRKGFRFVGDVRTPETVVEQTGLEATPVSDLPEQEVGFCRTNDGIHLAHARVGTGPILVKTANWLNHLEYDWQSPVWSPFYARLARRFHFVRYDGRGNGLSDRNVASITPDSFLTDLETVVDSLGLERFTLLGLSQGAAAAIRFSVRHPERVSRLILYGAYAQGRGRRGSPDDEDAAKTVLAMMRQGWGQEDSAFMRAFATLYLPGGTREQVGWFADLQRRTTSGDVAARLRKACDAIDVVGELAQVTVPTLVLHALHDQVVSIDQGRMVAAHIPGARFVVLESENHVPIPGEPAWERLLREIESFADGN